MRTGERIHFSVCAVDLRRHIYPENNEDYYHNGIGKNREPDRGLVVLNVPFGKRSVLFGERKLFFKVAVNIFSEHIDAADDYLKLFAVRRFDGQDVVFVYVEFRNLSFVEKVDNVSVCRGCFCA